MPVYVCIKPSSVARAGTWWIGDGPSHPLYRAELFQSGRNQWSARRVSPIAVEFRDLAPFIVEQGFQLHLDPLEHAALRRSEQTLGTEKPSSDEVEEFQRQTEDVYEEEKQKRDRFDDPSYRETWNPEFPNRPDPRDNPDEGE